MSDILTRLSDGDEVPGVRCEGSHTGQSLSLTKTHHLLFARFISVPHPLHLSSSQLPSGPGAPGTRQFAREANIFWLNSFNPLPGILLVVSLLSPLHRGSLGHCSWRSEREGLPAALRLRMNNKEIYKTS